MLAIGSPSSPGPKRRPPRRHEPARDADADPGWLGAVRVRVASWRPIPSASNRSPSTRARPSVCRRRSCVAFCSVVARLATRAAAPQHHRDATPTDTATPTQTPPAGRSRNGDANRDEHSTGGTLTRHGPRRSPHADQHEHPLITPYAHVHRYADPDGQRQRSSAAAASVRTATHRGAGLYRAGYLRHVRGLLFAGGVQCANRSGSAATSSCNDGCGLTQRRRPRRHTRPHDAHGDADVNLNADRNGRRRRSRQRARRRRRLR